MRVLAVTNMYPSFKNPALGVFVKEQLESLRTLGLDVNVLRVNRFQRGILAYVGLGQKVRKKMVEFGPDLVHVMYGGIMAERVITAVDTIPTMVSFCGSDLYGASLRGLTGQLASRFGALASHSAARKATRIVVKSKTLEAELPPDVDRSKVRIIPNGVDMHKFRPLDRNKCRAQLGWESNVSHVLFAGAIANPIKRWHLAAAAVDQVSSWGLHVVLHELWGVLHEEVPAWLNAANMVVVTSTHEGSPNIVKEALACNIPIVSVAIGDIPERIRDVEGCYLAKPDPHDLATKIRKVLEGPSRVDGRQAVQNLSLERVALRLGEFYEETLMGAPSVRLAGNLTIGS